MSYRVYLDLDSAAPDADFAVPRDGTITEAAAASAWQRPLKVIFTAPASLARYLHALDDHAAPPEEIWQIYQRRADGTLTRFGPEHPEWRDLAAVDQSVIPADSDAAP